MSIDKAIMGDDTDQWNRRQMLRSLAAVGPAGFVETATADTDRVIDDCTTITEPGEYELGGDIDAEGDCFEIATSGVTLDGNGHALRGDGSGTGIVVRADGTVMEFLVRNLTVREFETGVSVGWASQHGTIESTTIEANAGDGISVDELADPSFEDCTIRGNGGAAISARERSDVTLLDCKLRDNGGDAVASSVSVTVRVRRSLVVDNGGPVVICPVTGTAETELVDTEIRGSAGAGVRTGGTDLPLTSEPAPITNCEISDNGGPGIAHTHSFLEITDCRLSGNRDGYRLDNPTRSYEATLRDNVIEDNDEYGVAVDLSALPGDPVDARHNNWGASDGPSSPSAPLEDPVTGRLADGTGDAISEGTESGVAGARFDPFLSPSDPLVAAFAVDPAEPVARETAVFDGTTSDGAIDTYEWEFAGDGTDATGPVVPYAFEESGQYEVTLTVVGTDGETDQVSRTVDVRPPGGDLAAYRVGDTNLDGRLSIRDSAVIKQHLVGMEPAPFDPELADVNRNGEVSVRDSVLIKQYLVGMRDASQVEVDGVTVTGETVSADLVNAGGLGALDDARFWAVPDGDATDASTTIQRARYDLAPDGAGTVTFSLADLDAGDYVGTVHTDDDDETFAFTV